MIVLGAYLFGYFLTITQFTQKAVEFSSTCRWVHPTGARAGHGRLLHPRRGHDELAMILLTVPIVFPAMMHLGFDPIWFGVIIVMAVTFRMICPPSTSTCS